MAESTDVGAERIEIVLADDHALIRRGLRMVLEAEVGLAVVAEAGNVDEALRLTRELRPRVVVLDLHMPGKPTLPAIGSFVEVTPRPAVVVLTMEGDVAFARSALAAGASGYVLKEGAEADLVDAVRAAAAGRTYLDPGLGARLASAPYKGEATVAVGSTFAGHRIDAVVGKGGMAVVYRATDLALDRTVALKLIAPSLARDDVFRTRFERECKLAAALDHPHAVPVFHAGEEAGRLYVTMRYVEGTDMRALLEEEGRLDPFRAVGIVDQVAGALDEAHTLGLVHRDVKPANILIGRRRGAEHAFLADFGITKQRSAGESLTKTGIAVGTADYMAPEQAQGDVVDGRADVYALGCVLFRALSGAVLFDHDSDLDKLWAHVHEPPPALRDIRPELPAGLGEALARALAKDPSDRQPSAGQLAREALTGLKG